MTVTIIILIGILIGIIGFALHMAHTSAEGFQIFIAALAGEDVKESKTILPHVFYAVSFLIIVSGIVYGVY